MAQERKGVEVGAARGRGRIHPAVSCAVSCRAAAACAPVLVRAAGRRRRCMPIVGSGLYLTNCNPPLKLHTFIPCVNSKSILA